MSEEWQQQGIVTPVTGKQAPKFRWRKIGELWSCWSRSASARMLARLDPRSWRRRRSDSTVSATASPGCGCHGDSAMASVDVGIKLTTVSTRTDAIRDGVQQHYDAHAKSVRAGGDGCCGGNNAAGLPDEVSCVTDYADGDLQQVPMDAIVASLGCGNPFDRAGLSAGEIVLDLGSGGGLDAIVAARRVGADGHVFGLDMSDEMIGLARANTTKAGLSNVAFLKGDMESIPLPRESTDVIISNCVVNLVPDKARALAEAFRVLRPGGRLAISDIVTRLPVPPEMREDLSAWAACIGGALTVDEYRERLAAAGFVDIEVDREREYTARDAELGGVAPILERAGLADALALGFANTSVRARRPGVADQAEKVLVPSSSASTD
jgi:SAM-dependent methyltransferase